MIEVRINVRDVPGWTAPNTVILSQSFDSKWGNVIDEFCVEMRFLSIRDSLPVIIEEGGQRLERDIRISDSVSQDVTCINLLVDPHDFLNCVWNVLAKIFRGSIEIDEDTGLGLRTKIFSFF